MATTVTFERPDGQTVQGYLAEPQHALPVLRQSWVIQEWWGVNETDPGRRRPAGLGAGYIALVPDPLPRQIDGRG